MATIKEWEAVGIPLKEMRHPLVESWREQDNGRGIADSEQEQDLNFVDWGDDDKRKSNCWYNLQGGNITNGRVFKRDNTTEE